MKKLTTIITIFLTSAICYSQDSVRAKVLKTSEGIIVYKVGKDKFLSYCRCGLRKGDEFKIERKRFDSLLLEAKPIRRKDL